jgi:hypothetical protein
VVDEATELSEPAWEVLIPTIREEGSRFLICFNPEFEDDWVYKNFILQIKQLITSASSRSNLSHNFGLILY